MAVDPSSPFSGGAVLGDRIRMQSHFLDEGVFIRSLSARGNVGGLARAAREVARLMAAFGQDVIIVETVGVGQNEFDIMRLAETVVVVLVPEAGDTVQAMKAGLLEIADIFVVNKADREGAARMKSELELMLQLRPAAGWAVPVLLTVAVRRQRHRRAGRARSTRTTPFSPPAVRARAAAPPAAAPISCVRCATSSTAASRALSTPAPAPRWSSAVEQGALDPYAAMRRVFADPDFAGVLLGEPGENGAS